MAKKFVKVTGLHNLLAQIGTGTTYSLDATTLKSGITTANNNSICFVTCDSTDETNVIDVKNGSTGSVITENLHNGDTFIWTQGKLHITNNGELIETEKTVSAVLNGKVDGPSSSVANRIATFDGTTGKIIKDSGYTIATSVPSNAKFTDTKVADTASTTKAYLLGHTSQNSTSEAVTNSSVYMDGEELYAHNVNTNNLYISCPEEQNTSVIDFDGGMADITFSPVDNSISINAENTTISSQDNVNIQFNHGTNYIFSEDGMDSNRQISAPSFFENGVSLSNKYEMKNRCLPLSGGTMTGNIDMSAKDLIVYQKTKIGQTGGYLGLYSTGNELVIGNGSTDGTMYINYHAPGTGYIAPSTYVFMAGSGSSYANIQANHFYSISDNRLKNIHEEIDLDKAYDLIDKCSTILYDLKDDEKHKVQIGVIAQEIQEFFPEIINEDEKGMLSVDYSKLTVIIMRVLKDLINRIKKLEEK